MGLYFPSSYPNSALKLPLMEYNILLGTTVYFIPVQKCCFENTLIHMLACMLVRSLFARAQVRDADYSRQEARLIEQELSTDRNAVST